MMALIAVDLPEFERPAKAISRPESGGELVRLGRTGQEFHIGVGRHGRRLDANY